MEEWHDRVESDRWEMLCEKSFPLSQPIELLGLGPFGLFTLNFVRCVVCINLIVTFLSVTTLHSGVVRKLAAISQLGEHFFSLCLSMIGGIAYLL